MFRLLPKMRAAKAAKARKAAWDAHQDSLAKGDTRRQHDTRAALMRATHDKLKLELAAR